MTTSGVVFFGDLVCPFCYALDERLAAIGVADEVVWCGVQHAPRLPTPMAAAYGEQRAALVAEVQTVSRLAPEAPITAPPGLPNSRLATETIANLTQQRPADAVTARLASARAVWRDGRDISDVSVLQEVLAAAGVAPVAIDEPARILASTWQRAWEQSGIGVVPALVGTDGAVARGLITADELDRFLHLAPRRA